MKVNRKTKNNKLNFSNLLDSSSNDERGKKVLFSNPNKNKERSEKYIKNNNQENEEEKSKGDKFSLTSNDVKEKKEIRKEIIELYNSIKNEIKSYIKGNENKNINLVKNILEKITKTIKNIIQKATEEKPENIFDIEINNEIKENNELKIKNQELVEEMALYKNLLMTPKSKKIDCHKSYEIKKLLLNQKNKNKLQEYKYLITIKNQEDKINKLEEKVNNSSIKYLPKKKIGECRCFPNYSQYEPKLDLNPKSIPMFLNTMSNSMESNGLNKTSYLYSPKLDVSSILDKKNKEYFLSHPNIRKAGLSNKNGRRKTVKFPIKYYKFKLYKHLGSKMVFPSAYNETMLRLEKMRKLKSFEHFGEGLNI